LKRALQLPIAPYTTFTSLDVIIISISINKSDISRLTADLWCYKSCGFNVGVSHHFSASSAMMR